jgi:hypothetical protein
MMSNWFEDNPTKSIIGYTLVIVAATWAASTFVLQDNRLNLVRSQLETQKSLTEQYKSKAELLQRDIDALRAENAEYRTWLGQTKDAIPIIVPRITALKEKVARLEAGSTRAGIQTKAELIRERSARLGTAFIDDVTGVVLTVTKTTPDLRAQLIVKFPGKDVPVEANISPGQQWRFKFKDKDYLLTVTEINFLNDTVRFRITSE